IYTLLNPVFVSAGVDEEWDKRIDGDRRYIEAVGRQPALTTVHALENALGRPREKHRWGGRSNCKIRDHCAAAEDVQGSPRTTPIDTLKRTPASPETWDPESPPSIEDRRIHWINR